MAWCRWRALTRPNQTCCVASWRSCIWIVCMLLLPVAASGCSLASWRGLLNIAASHRFVFLRSCLLPGPTAVEVVPGAPATPGLLLIALFLTNSTCEAARTDSKNCARPQRHRRPARSAVCMPGTNAVSGRRGSSANAGQPRLGIRAPR